MNYFIYIFLSSSSSSSNTVLLLLGLEIAITVYYNLHQYMTDGLGHYYFLNHLNLYKTLKLPVLDPIFKFIQS